MLSYQHGYHAGNHADLLKHCALALCLQARLRKSSPLCVFDTHSGRGLYDLADVQALKNQEFASGIAAVWEQRQALPELYRQALAHYNGNGALRYYPGSAAIIAKALRPQDEAIFCEAHPAEHAALAHNLHGQSGLRILAADGWQQARALLPPAQKRGLVLIDPSYERPEDFQAAASLANHLCKHFRAATILIWFPCLAGSGNLRRALAPLAQGRDCWTAELSLAQSGERGMHASAMACINAPFGAAQALNQCMHALLPLLGPTNQVGWRMDSELTTHD
nr:23S rRNA (adenine(2030)-N(6))-methyltransferase RlmJ [Oceanococcus sp. HetDA_MAG_MS8]